MPEQIAFGTCACGATGQLFKTGKCAHCYIAELESRSQYVPERLRALLEGLECEEIDNLMQQPPDTLKAVGVEIAKAAKLGAYILAHPPSISSRSES